MSAPHNTKIVPRPTGDGVSSWRSIEFAARFYGRSKRQIRNYCNFGLFARRGIHTYRDSRGRWWILIEAPLERNGEII
jgi:hypothetical protein